jgi:Fic family protein
MVIKRRSVRWPSIDVFSGDVSANVIFHRYRYISPFTYRITMKYADTDTLYHDSLFQRIDEKKKRLDSLRPLSKEAVQQLLQDIRLRHTYNSDAIEGNTLTLQETRLVLEEGITIGGKPLKDHLEARNDAEAFDLMIHLVNEKKPITQEVIQQLHEAVAKAILSDAGKYRTTNIRIMGSSLSPPDYGKIVPLMDAFMKQIQKEHIHPIRTAAFIHHELSRIHPFVDGNGRVARLLTNLYLMQHGYPPLIVKKTDRRRYYQSLQQADRGDLVPFTRFLASLAHESLMMYLSSVVSEERLVPLKELVDGSPYSQEYLSLRARQGKLDAVKIEKAWFSSRRALQEYRKKK